MGKFQELLDIIKDKGGNVEATRKSVLDAVIALDASTETIAEAMIDCINDCQVTPWLKPGACP